MHANEFLSDDSLLKPGSLVEFETVESERGIRAIDVRHIGGSEPDRVTAPVVSDALTISEFLREVTDLIIEGAPTATGQQIVQIRERFSQAARSHGWVLD